MESSLNDLMEKVRAIITEVEKVEYKLLSTKTHVETIERSVEAIAKEILEGFHKVSAKVNHLEETVRRLEEKIDKLSK